MKRREFILGLGGAAAWPVAVRAQQPPLPVVAFLHQGRSDGAVASFVAGFTQGLNDLGYNEGQNVLIERRWAEGHYDQLPAIAADLVHHRATVIVAAYLPAALAAKAATVTIPIVFISGTDPVESGLLASFNRPGANITGVSVLSTPLAAKRLELLREVVPTADRIAIIVNPSNPNAVAQLRDFQAAASTLQQKIIVYASTEVEIDNAFAALAQQRAGALLVGADAFLEGRRSQLIDLAARNAVPAISASREYTAIGGLMSYGPNYPDLFRRAAQLVGKILRGAKPTDIPVEQPTKFDLVINLKAAKALGLTISPSLLARADEVIE
jgi:putative tryptophan/tyrosine transport system substrate-binding protein